MGKRSTKKFLSRSVSSYTSPLREDSLHSVTPNELAAEEKTVSYVPTEITGSITPSKLNAMIGNNGEWLNVRSPEPPLRLKNNGTPVLNRWAMHRHNIGLLKSRNMEDPLWAGVTEKKRFTAKRLSAVHKKTSRRKRRESRKMYQTSGFCPRCFCFDTKRRLVKNEPTYRNRMLRAVGATWICENCGMNNAPNSKRTIKERTYKTADESCMKTNQDGSGV